MEDLSGRPPGVELEFPGPDAAVLALGNAQPEEAELVRDQLRALEIPGHG